MHITVANPYFRKGGGNRYMNIMLFLHRMMLPTILLVAVVAEPAFSARITSETVSAILPTEILENTNTCAP